MLGTASPGFRRKLGDAVRLIDSTGVHLAGLERLGAVLTQVRGAKAHVVFDPDQAGQSITRSAPPTSTTSAPPKTCRSRPERLTSSTSAITTRLVGAARRAGCRLVTRFKKNTPLALARALPLDPRACVVSDRIGFLPDRLAGNRKNPMADAVREIVVTTQSGKTCASSPTTSMPRRKNRRPLQAPLGKSSCSSAMKQTLKLASFLGRSENAVRIQVAWR